MNSGIIVLILPILCWLLPGQYNSYPFQIERCCCLFLRGKCVIYHRFQLEVNGTFLFVFVNLSICVPLLSSERNITECEDGNTLQTMSCLALTTQRNSNTLINTFDFVFCSTNRETGYLISNICAASLYSLILTCSVFQQTLHYFTL